VAWRAALQHLGPTGKLLYHAMAAASSVVVASTFLTSHGQEDSTKVHAWQRECNSQTGFHHGGVAYLRRWGLVLGGTQSDRSPLRIAPYTYELGKSLAALLTPSAHEFVQGFRPVSSLSEWAESHRLAASKLHALNLPGCSSGPEAYGVIWTCRYFQWGANLPQRSPPNTAPVVAVSPTDEVSGLSRAFLDMSGEAERFARALRVTTVQDLLTVLEYPHGVEYFCMDLCLMKPVYRWLERHRRGFDFLQRVAPHMDDLASRMKLPLGLCPSITSVLGALEHVDSSGNLGTSPDAQGEPRLDTPLRAGSSEAPHAAPFASSGGSGEVRADSAGVGAPAALAVRADTDGPAVDAGVDADSGL